ncbi:MAG TPA: hypothetical protein VH114_09795 [Candidatus Acidoferrum sp.]|nr:hypothetical protein [Candidatus Acidoferrum sp.]
MDEKRSNEAVYSREPTQSSTTDAPPESNESADSPHADTHETPRAGGYSPVMSRTGARGPAADFVEFLKSTKRVWLIVAAAIIGLLLVVTLAKRLFENVSASRDARQHRAVGTLTAEGLLDRCGQPTEDVTKEVYPIVMRTITYQRSENEKYVFEFSRTAEEKSDWVFLSMKDQSGAKKFDTPEAKIAAMSCLDK